MSFLHGVLSGVKDDDNVTTYDKDVQAPKIGTGPEDFETALADVSWWITKYFGELQTKTDAVSNALSDLINNKIGKESMKSVAAKNDVKLNEQLANWTSVLENIETNVNSIEDKNVSKLDKVLKQRIGSEMSGIRNAVWMLRDSAKEKDFVGQVSKVDEQLEGQKSNVLALIKNESDSLQARLENEFGNIWNGIKNLNYMKKMRFEKISKAHKSVEDLLGKFDVEYTDQLIGKIEYLRWNLDQLTNDDSTLQKNFTKVDTMVKALVENVQKDLATLKGKIHGQMKGYVTKYVQAVQGEVTKIKKEVLGTTGKGTGSGIYHDWSLLKNYIERLVNGIYKEEQKARTTEKSGRLYVIVNGVKKYADLFTKTKFGDIVKGWIEDILGNNGMVKHWVREYVTDSENRDKLRTKLNIENTGFKAPTAKAIATKIKDALSGQIAEASAEDESQIENKDIKGQMEYVQVVCNRFANALGKELEKSILQRNFSVGEITQQINKTLAYSGDEPKHTLKLQNAVYATLTALQSKARQTANELELYLNDKFTNLSKNVHGAISYVKSIGDQFANGQVSIGKNITKALQDVHPVITDLDTHLQQATTESSKPVIPPYSPSVTPTPSDNLEEKIKGILNQEIGTTSGEKIQKTFTTGFMEKFDGAEKQLKIAVPLIGEQLNALKEVAKSVGERKGEAQTLMNNLKGEIFENSNALFHAVKEADDTLTRSISALVDAYDTARETLKKAIQELQKKLTTAAENAFNIITTQVQKLFANHKMADLKSLQSLVQTQKTDIERIIRLDKFSGVKGLLKQLKDDIRRKSNNENKFDALKNAPNHNDFKSFVEKMQTYFTLIYDYVKYQMDEYVKKQSPSEASDVIAKLGRVKDKLDKTLEGLTTSNHFDYTFKTNVDALNSALQYFAPLKFGGPCTVLLDVVKEGVQALAGQLGKAYVNKYDGHEDQKEFNSFVSPTSKNDELTPYATNLAKVLLTLMEGLRKDVFDLQNECGKTSGGWGNMNIILGNKLGDWFKNRGYLVSKLKQDGELRNHDECKGEKIKSELLTKKITEGSTSPIIKAWKETNKENPEEISLYDMVEFLREFLRKYYNVCQHIHIDKPKAPTNIYQMMQWLSGLYFNPMLKKLDDQFNGLFGEANQLDIAVPDSKHYTINSPLKASNLADALKQVCLLSQLSLVAFLGNGHADGRYACDFRTNLDKLNYPSNPSACFDMLVDILHRVFYQLRFLHSQCSNSRSRGGWQDCWYGQGVGGSSWQCNEKQCANQTPNQSADQTCDQHPNCGVKSPLQSFLEDGLPGFLPHQFKSPGCKLTCNMSNHRGIPCLTPMGFGDISFAASHTKTGSHLRAELDHLCGGAGKSLSKLCGMLDCLLRVAPQTLGDMFGFYYNFLANWNSGIEHRQTAFNDAVKKANFWNDETKLNVASLQASKVHPSNHDKGDLFSITDCNPTSTSGLPCGRYLHPITLYTRSVFTEKHADNYLSWVTYITETFLALLHQLYESCKKCETPGTRCCDKGCEEKCPVKAAYASDEPSKQLNGQKHTTNCHSIVKCPYMHPTLYQYGFTFGSPSGLSGHDKDIRKRRTCRDFCEALKRVIGDNCVLVKLIGEIDEFMKEIRWPFMLTLTTLWSLSLLYLLHIAVVRLDVLRIRSHLRSPSSHRIAAQSLLAAARVKALANIKHGNGPGDQGLEPLADALKKLIGDAIKNATTSLSHKSSKLSCSPNPHDPLSYCSQLDRDIKSKNEELQKAKNTNKTSEISSLEAEIQRYKSNKDDCTKSHFMDEQRMSSLEAEVHHGIDVIVKLTQFSGGEDSVKTLIEKEIARLEKHKKDCENCKKSPQPHASADCPQHKKLDELEEKLETLQQNNDKSPHDLLNNLCSGLEKFLGYQETSKGYSGEGIVYSDLDRLCDGVMSFLHGVLETVKDDDNVTTYDVKDSNNNITSLIKLLENSVGKGRQAFAEAVAKVSEWLKKHGAQVDQKTGEVTEGLSSLIGKLNNGSNSVAGVNYYNQVNEQAGEPLASQLQTWKQTLYQIDTDVTNINTNNSKLDNALKRSVMHEMSVVSEAVKMLNTSSWGNHLMLQVGNVDTALDAQKTRMINKIKEQYDSVQKTLKNEFFNVVSVINNLNKAKAKKIKHIRGAIDTVKVHLKTFDADYREKIQKLFNDISEKLVELNPNSTHIVGDGSGNSRLKLDVEDVKSRLRGIDNKLAENVKQLQNWMVAALRSIHKIQQEVKKIIDREVGESKKTEIDQAAQNIRTQTTQLHNQYEGVKRQLAEQVNKVKAMGGSDAPLNRLQNLESQLAVPNDNVSSIKSYLSWDGRDDPIIALTNKIEENVKQHIRSQILTGIHGQLGTILDGSKKPQDSGLRGIKQKVEEYAKTIGDNMQKTTVQMWLNRILDKDPVNGLLGKYFRYNSGDFKGAKMFTKASDLHIPIKEGIAKVLQEDVYNTVRLSYAVDTGGNVKSDLTSLNNFLQQYATQLDKQLLTATGTTSFVKKIADKIESDEGLHIDPLKRIGPNSPLQLPLIDAIRFILQFISASARNLGEEIASLANNNSGVNIGTSIDGALGVAEPLENQIKEAITNNDPLSSGTSIAIQVAGIAGKVGPAAIDTELAKLLKATADKAIIKLKDEIQNTVISKLSSVDNQVSGFEMQASSAKLLLETKAQEVENKLGELMTEISNHARDNIKFFLDHLREGNICSSLNAIKDELNTQQSNVNSVISNGIHEVLQKTKQLENVPQKVREGREAAEKLMDTLKRELENRIHDVEVNVNEAEKELTVAIDTLTNAVLHAQQAVTQCLSELKENLIDTAESSFDVITTHVRSLFTHQKLADLSALHKLVERQHKKINKIIDEDKASGIKGLLSRMQIHHPTLSEVPRLEEFTKASTTTKWYMDYVTEYIKYQLLPDTKPPTPTTPVPPPISSGGYKARPAMAIAAQVDSNYYKGRAGMAHNTTYTGAVKSPTSTPTPNQHSPSPSAKNPIEKFFDDLKLHADRLFGTLSMGRFSNQSATNRDAFTNFLNSMRPEKFAQLNSPLLDILKSGLESYLKELSYAYVNAYEGHPSLVDFTSEVDGKNCAKTFLSLLETLFDDLGRLSAGCKKRFSKSTISRSSDLGELFKRYGYRVASHSKSQDGELLCKNTMNGEKVHEKLHEKKFTSSDKIEHLKECESNEVDVNSKKKKHDNFDIFDLLKCLHRHLEEYYSVGHIATFTSMKQPCSVNEMLSWFSGLPYNAAYSTLLRDGFTSLLQKPKPKTIQGGDEFEVELDDLKSYYIDAYPNRITYDHINTALDHICSISYDILTSIAGHGDEYTTYAADFCTNHLSLSYPSIPSQCLDMLLDILRRLLPQLRYLFNRCKLSTKHSGWSQCLYGRDVFTTKSPCNNHSNSKPNSRPKCQPTCQANTKPNCQPTSPLMSYLTDSLPGHLPHDVSSIGCRSVCSTCPNGKKGMPCLTPLGFRGFSGSTRKGEEICDILDKFFSNFYLSSLFCLSPKTPASLPEQFGFVLSLVSGWNSPKTEATSRIKKSVESSIESVSINLYDQPTKLTAALTNAYRNTHSNHGGKDHLPAYSDVYSLAMTSACNDRVGKALCAPYVASLCGDTYAYFAEKHCNTYLSWAVYLPWTFWDLLNNLYNAFCNITCADWGCRGCLRGDKCRSGKHGVVEDEKQDAICQCDSIVSCRGVAPTLYQYGFSFGEASTLNSGDTAKKCKDFCSQLKNVLKSEYFQTLFKECDNFLREIRWPFMLTLLALWSLSLLYLLHIAVVRLDVLRIRSHLRSPSSHRIAAQSLLAAARVKALANVKYFSP
ncbi:hypothetical protein, conserved [Babesia ovata]|uniref:C3H1-type domain-containing protein n=1 Tax=Babesia ovata TaxID=189622 RepID=A0A2H6KKA7_9APIC|nr:uncharacterized protein BOVATA_049010 [Babesia ovata]GBE63408.1 hypothetical protein, conserved [Babesia ovata]